MKIFGACALVGGLSIVSACGRPAQAPAAPAVTVAQPASLSPDLYAQPPARGAFEKLAFNPDGTLLAGLTIDQSQVVLWDVASGLEVRAMSALSQPPAKPAGQPLVYPPTAIAFSADGRLIGGAVDRFLKPEVPEVPMQAWDVASGAPARASGTFAFRRDGQLKIEVRRTSPASVDLEVSNAASGARAGVLARLQYGVLRVSISADQRWLIALDAEHARLLDVRAGVELPWPATIPGGIVIAQFSPAGRYLLIVHRPEVNVQPVTLIEPGTWRVLRELDRFPDPSWTGTDAAFSADDSKVAVTLGAEPYLWETASGRKLQQFGSVGMSAATTVAFSPDGGWLGVGGSEDSSDFPFDVYNHVGVTTLWPLDGTAPRHVRHDRSVRGLAFSPDGCRVAVATQHEVRESRASGVLEGNVELGDISDPIDMQKLLDAGTAYPRSATSVAFANGGKVLIAAVTDIFVSGEYRFAEFQPSTRLGMWDAGTGALIREVDARQDALVSMTFSRDEKLIATADLRGANIWNVARPARRLRRVGGAWDPAATAVAFSPDGRLLVVGSDTLSLIDAETGAIVRSLEQEKTGFGVTALAFSRDGRTMATAACESVSPPQSARPDAIRLRDTSSWATTGSVPVSACVGSMSFSADGRALATVSSDGKATLWRVSGRHASGVSGDDAARGGLGRVDSRRPV